MRTRKKPPPKPFRPSKGETRRAQTRLGKAKPATREQLIALRHQHGTKGAAERLGIPPASLRRLISTGKGGGLPKTSSALLELGKKVTVARVRAKGPRTQLQLHRELSRLLRSGAYESELYALAQQYQMNVGDLYRHVIYSGGYAA